MFLLNLLKSCQFQHFDVFSNIRTNNKHKWQRLVHDIHNKIKKIGYNPSLEFWNTCHMRLEFIPWYWGQHHFKETAFNENICFCRQISNRISASDVKIWKASSKSQCFLASLSQILKLFQSSISFKYFLWNHFDFIKIY